MQEPDIVVVGAGAAGIGAGLELRERGIPFVILEAAHRVGGRAHTDTRSLPVAWDRGCHWLHCADVNPLVPWADRLGAGYLREERIDAFAVWSGGRKLGREEAAEARAGIEAAFAAVYAAADADRDVPISEVVPNGGRWDAAARYILQLMACEDAERVSARGYGDYEDTGVNWPVVSGYGDLVTRMAEGLPVRLGVRVTGVGKTPRGVRVETPDGAIGAKAAIVTVSTNVLASGAIAFGTGSARDLLDHAAHVPCGAYEKVAIAFSRSPVGDGPERFCMVEPGDGSFPLDFQIAPGGQPVMIAHMAGSLARDLAAAGEAAMTAAALDRLAAAFGSDVQKQVRATAVTGWQNDPFVLGGYSYVTPGAYQRRRQMIAADTGAIAFAGEAFSPAWQATAHGAYQTGRDAAARLASRLVAKRTPPG
ncbi:MAG: FAD-dependent oxidoreductase [Paracoccaceae bacterium]